MGSFYEALPGDGLRLGDVVRGFRVTTPHVDAPACETPSAWSIAVADPKYLVVMTPCCSIEKKSIALAPLVPIRPSFLTNEHFAADLTRINRKVKPEFSVSRRVWDCQMTAEDRNESLARGECYLFLECFIYEAHDLLQEYRVGCKDEVHTRYYMVDFKDICRVNCDKINRKGADTLAPPGTKLLQLSVKTRQELRDKLTYYFARIPDEDQV